jgi:hypothetical protein
VGPSERPTNPALWARLSEICSRLPDVTERISHGERAWFVGTGKRQRQFVTTWDHHHDDRNGVVMAAPPGAQEQLVGAEPERYFRPPYVGPKGWIGIYLDVEDVDWDRVELHLIDAHAEIAG